MKNTITLLLCLIALLGTAKNKTWTCIDQSGNSLFKIEAMFVHEFHNGLAKVYKNTLVNNKWITGYGFINKQGKIVIPCDLKKAADFKGDYTWVKKAGQDYFSLLHKSGKYIPTKHYKKVGFFYDFQKDICAVYEDGRMGFVDLTGKEIIPCKYIGAGYFKDGLCSVQLYNDTEGSKEAYGFINKKGEVVIPLKARQGGDANFENGYARYNRDGKTVLIDTTGATFFKTSKGNIQSYTFGLVSVFSGRNRTDWGWINTKDEVVIPLKYDYAQSFNEDGYAVVELNKLRGVIDTTGKIIIPLQYETVYANPTKDGFIMGVYPAENGTSLMDTKKDYFDSKANLISMNGNYIYHANYQDLYMFKSIENGKIGYLNSKYNEVIPAQFTKGSNFSEGLAWVYSMEDQPVKIKH
jgi:hypothetical protein